MNRPLAPLAVAFGVLAVLVLWKETSRGTTRTLVEEADLRPLHAAPFTADDVAKVEVTAPGGTKPAYTLVREDKSWRVVGDFKAPASGASVKKLLDALARAEGEFRSDDKAALEQFDLTRERAVGVKVLGKDGATLMDVGVGRTSGSQGAFVRNFARGEDESKALSVTSNLRGLFGLSRTAVGDRTPDKPEPDFFHDKEFPQFKFDAAKRVEVSTPLWRVELESTKKDEKDAKGEWQVKSGGPGASFKKEAVDTALRAFGGGFRPMKLVDPAKRKELGFDAPKYRLVVETEDGTKRTVVGSSDAAAEHWYVRLDAEQDPDVVYEAADWEFHQLFPRGSALFDLKLPEVPDAELGRVEVVSTKDGATRRIEMERSGTTSADDWKLVVPGKPFTPKQSSLRNLASTLKSLRPTDYADSPELGPATVTVKYGAPSAKPEEMKTVEVGDESPTGKDRRVRVPGSERVWVVADATIERLAPEPLTVIEPKLLHGWNAEDVKAVRVEGETPESAPTFSLVREDGTWSLVRGEQKKPADAAAAGAWVGKLLDAEAKAMRNEDAAGRPEARITVENAKGESVTVVVLAVDKDKRWARAGGLEFELPEKDFVPDPATLEAKPAPPPAPPKDETK